MGTSWARSRSIPSQDSVITTKEREKWSEKNFMNYGCGPVSVLVHGHGP